MRPRPDPLPSAPVLNWTTILFAAMGVLFIGLSKAGFGGGLGMLTTPLCVLAFSAGGQPPSFAVGVLLPLLCAGDAFSLYHYWGKWEVKNLKYLLPGVVVGVVCTGVTGAGVVTGAGSDVVVVCGAGIATAGFARAR